MSDIVATENTFCFPVCNKCKHHLGGDKCYAFDKIPKEILMGDTMHNKVLLEQKNDIVFEEKK